MKSGSAGKQVRGNTCVEKAFALIDEFGDAFEPERLGHISLGQENSRMRMNAAPGLFFALNTNPEGRAIFNLAI